MVVRDWFKNILTRHVGLVSFTAAVCVFTLATFQAPLLSYALRFSDLHTVEGWVHLIVASVVILPFRRPCLHSGNHRALADEDRGRIVVHR